VDATAAAVNEDLLWYNLTTDEYFSQCNLGSIVGYRLLQYFFFWPLCCLFFFDIRILITSLWYLQTLLKNHNYAYDGFFFRFKDELCCIISGKFACDMLFLKIWMFKLVINLWWTIISESAWSFSVEAN
jgi:hypothetical protein